MAAAEEPRKLLFEAGIDALEGLLETRARFLVNAAHRLLERRQRLGEISELPVEVLLFFRLILQLVDRGKIDLPELFDIGTRLGEGVFPDRDARIRLQIGVDVGEDKLRGG